MVLVGLDLAGAWRSYISVRGCLEMKDPSTTRIGASRGADGTAGSTNDVGLGRLRATWHLARFTRLALLAATSTYSTRAAGGGRHET